MDEEQKYDALPTEDDLVKAMDILEETARGIEGGNSVQKQDLSARFAADPESLTKSERDQLARLVQGDEEDDLLDLIEKSSREVFAESDDVVDGWRANAYLDARDTALGGILDDIKKSLVDSHTESGARDVRLLKGLHAVGMSNVVLSRKVDELTDMLKSITGQKARQPAHTGKGATRVGQRFEDTGPKGERLAKSDGAEIPFGDPEASKAWLNGQLSELIKSTEPGGANAAHGFGNINGIDLVHEQAKLENANQVSPACMQLIKQHAGIN